MHVCVGVCAFTIIHAYININYYLYIDYMLWKLAASAFPLFCSRICAFRYGKCSTVWGPSFNTDSTHNVSPWFKSYFCQSTRWFTLNLLFRMQPGEIELEGFVDNSWFKKEEHWTTDAKRLFWTVPSPLLQILSNRPSCLCPNRSGIGVIPVEFVSGAR